MSAFLFYAIFCEIILPLEIRLAPQCLRSIVLKATGNLKMSAIIIRDYIDTDADAVWTIMEPIIRAGETYALPTTLSKDEALNYWLSNEAVFVIEDAAILLGTYFLRANHEGGGSHVANCGYMVAPWAQGRGVAKLMCAHSLAEAKARKFKAMQFNYVISSNERACQLWQSFDFEIVGRLPGAFKHPELGFVDVFVMYREL